jgi:hypothetical protein
MNRSPRRALSAEHEAEIDAGHRAAGPAALWLLAIVLATLLAWTRSEDAADIPGADVEPVPAYAVEA